MPKLLIGASACYRSDISLEQFMDFIVAEGCTYMELREYVSDWNQVFENLEYDRIRREASNRKLRLTFHTPLGLNLAEEDANLRRRMLSEYDRCLELAERVGPEVLVIHTGGHDDHRRGMELTLDGLRHLIARKGDGAYHLAIENGGRGVNQVLQHPKDVAAFLELDVRFCIDMGHAHLHGHTVREFLTVCGVDRVAEIHTHSNDGIKDRHWAIDEGSVDVLGAIRDALAAGFEGPFMLENPGRDRIVQSMAYFREQIIPTLQK